MIFLYAYLFLIESSLAEREGFEPSVRKAYNGFRDRPVQPLRHLSKPTLGAAGIEPATPTMST